MQKGFTLLELVITLTILLILASFSYSVSIDYLTRSRRIDGQTALLDLANRMETYYRESGNYATATIGTGTSTDILSSGLSPQGFYRLTIVSQTEMNYVLKASVLGIQALQDKNCKALYFDSGGLKSGGSPHEKNRDCWN